MIDKPQWIYVDTVLFLLQLLMIGLHVRRYHSRIGRLQICILAFSAYLFTTPLGLIPVGILSDPPNNMHLVRYAMWHLKCFKGLSFNDLLIIGLILLMFLTILVRQHISKWCLAATLGSLMLFGLGLISLLQAPNSIDLKNIFNSFRSFLLILLGIFAGYPITKKLNNYSWVTDYLWLLVKVSLISIISMILLNDVYRPGRYWSHAILQSQSSALPLALLSGMIVFKSKLTAELTTWKKLLTLIIGIGVACSGYKGLILLYLLFAVLWFDSNLFNIHRLFTRNKLLFFLLLFLLIWMNLIVVLINYTTFHIDSLNTRLFQIKNSMTTLVSDGVHSLLFGIGWKQWYTVYFPFPTKDFGAWNPNELVNDRAKFAIQIPPFSLIRSIGLMGLGILFAIMTTLFYKISLNIKSIHERDSLFFLLLLTLFQIFFTFPDILPECCLAVSILTVAFLCPIQNAADLHEVCNEWEQEDIPCTQ